MIVPLIWTAVFPPMKRPFFFAFAAVFSSVAMASAVELPVVEGADAQPLFAKIRRALEAAAYRGAPRPGPGNGAAAAPLQPELGGLVLEYRIAQLYSRDAGKREAKVSFNVGQGTQDLGFRNETDVLFTCLPARGITLRVRDENDQPCVASFLIRDR